MFKQVKTFVQCLKIINKVGFENLEHFKMMKNGKIKDIDLSVVKNSIDFCNENYLNFTNLEGDFFFILNYSLELD